MFLVIGLKVTHWSRFLLFSSRGLQFKVTSVLYTFEINIEEVNKLSRSIVNNANQKVTASGLQLV